MIEIPESIIRFGSEVTHSEPEFKVGGTKIEGSFNAIVNTTDGTVGGTVDKASFLAIRPGHEVKLNVAGEMQSTIEVQMLALPFTQGTTLQETFATSIQAEGFAGLFRNKYVLNVKIEQSTVTLAIADLSPRFSPRLVVPVTAVAREIRFALDAEQNFVVYINDELIMQHRIDAGLIAATDDHVVMVFNTHSVGLEIPPAPLTVAYELTAQPLLADHDYVTPPADVYHYGQVESLTQDGEYILAPNQYYVADQVAIQHSSVVAPLDGTIQRIRINGNGITSAVSAFANIGALRMNSNAIAETNIFTLARVEGQVAAVVWDVEQGQGYEMYGIASVTLETAVVAGNFKAQWYATSTEGLHYGYALEFPISFFSGINEGLRWIWQLQSFDIYGVDYLSTSAIVEITSPAQYVPVTFEEAPDGGSGGGGEPPDFSQDFIADGGTSSVMETDIYWGQIENMQWMDPTGFEPWQFAKLVLNANDVHTDPYALSYAIPPSTSVGSVMYFVLPLNGQEGYTTTGSGTDVAGFDPFTLSALIEIQVYLDGDQKMVQFSHIAGSHTEEGSISFPMGGDDYFEFQARIDPSNNTVQMFNGPPGNAVAFGPQMSVFTLQRISLILKTQDLQVIGRYGSSDAFLSDVAPIVIYNGDRVLESTDPISYRYDMLPAPLDHYDPNLQELVNNDLAFMHVIAPPVNLSLAQLALQNATGGMMGFYPEAPCTVRFILGMFPNVNDAFSLNVPQVRVGALEVIVPYGADGQIDGTIFYRLVGSDGINYVFSQVIPHSPDEGYETGWTVGISFGSPTAPSTHAAGVVIFNRFDGTKLTLDSTRNIGTNNNFNDADGYVIPVENHPLFMSYNITPIGPAVNVPMRQVFVATGMPVEPL